MAALVAAAARGAAQGGGSSEPLGLGASDELGFFCVQVEEVLTAVGESMGLEGRATVTQAKDALRRTGADGAKAASRLGKLTKARNAGAHPDVALLGDVRVLLGKRETQEGKGGGEAGGGESSEGDGTLLSTQVAQAVKEKSGHEKVGQTVFDKQKELAGIGNPNLTDLAEPCRDTLTKDGADIADAVITAALMPPTALPKGHEMPPTVLPKGHGIDVDFDRQKKPEGIVNPIGFQVSPEALQEEKLQGMCAPAELETRASQCRSAAEELTEGMRVMVGEAFRAEVGRRLHDSAAGAVEGASGGERTG